MDINLQNWVWENPKQNKRNEIHTNQTFENYFPGNFLKVTRENKTLFTGGKKLGKQQIYHQKQMKVRGNGTIFFKCS